MWYLFGSHLEFWFFRRLLKDDISAAIEWHTSKLILAENALLGECKHSSPRWFFLVNLGPIFILNDSHLWINDMLIFCSINYGKFQWVASWLLTELEFNNICMAAICIYISSKSLHIYQVFITHTTTNINQQREKLYNIRE